MRPIPFSIPASEDSVVTEEDKLPFFYNYLHYHKELQVTYILKGDGTLIVDNFCQPFEQGDVFIIGSNQPHIFKSNKSHFEELTDNRIHAFHIYFDTDKLKGMDDFSEIEEINHFLSTARHGFQVPATALSFTYTNLDKIRFSCGLSKLMHFLELLQFFAEESSVWKSLSSGQAETVGHQKGGRMSTIYEYTLKHFREDITLEKIAQVTHMTPQAFCKYFKKHTSKTYLAFLQEIRITEACKLIINSDSESIATLAYECGFNSTVNFNKVFKKITGSTPSEYIRRHRINENGKLVFLAS